MAKFNYKTVTRKILADLYTPVGVYMRLRDIYPQSALMESSDYHGSENSRSFIGVHPLASIAVSHGEVIKSYPDGSVEKETLPAFGEGKGEQCKLAISKSINDFTNSLMPQADTQHWFDARIFFNNIHQKTSLRRNTRPRTQYNLIEWLQLAQLELVIAINRNFCSQLLHQMCQIIGEGIVIIYDYYFHLHYLLLIIY